MSEPDPNKEITLTVGELDVLIQAACSQAILEHSQLQAKRVAISKKIQAQLEPAPEARD